MKNFKLWGSITIVGMILMCIAHLYDNIVAYIILGLIFLISLVLTINSIEL